MNSRLAISFDPSYISKSDKCTPCLGRFWFGCVGKVKLGLEISSICVMGLDLHTCLQLEAVQTPSPSTLETVDWSLADWYLHILRVRKESLLKITPYVVADAYFSKVTFVNGAIQMGLHVISRLRDDVSLRCLTAELLRSGRGTTKMRR